jgi:MFS family permease
MEMAEATTGEVGVTAVRAATVMMNPDGSGLPGGPVIQQLTNGIGGWALIASLIGLVIGAAMWALGHYSQNYQQAYNGRKGVLVSGASALLIGGAQGIVNFFANLGTRIK